MCFYYKETITFDFKSSESSEPSTEMLMTKSTENIEKKIEAQLEKLKQLKAQKQAIEARERTKQKEQERKQNGEKINNSPSF